ncbi:MAG: ABC transporter ATP-binding protein [Cyanobacteria bacterium P01_F01_bin.150]
MIEVEQLSKLYGTSPAIQDVSFTVEEGEIIGFLGPNGAGKTTTMRILTGYLPATKGTARVAGFDVHDDSMAVRQRIGYLPETPPLYPEMTVEGFLNFVARIKGVAAGDRAERVNSAMTRCNLLDKKTILIRKLSKGFRQRVGIAQSIVHDPPVIILDEPTVGLDPRQIIDVRNLIKSLAGDHTIILSTHILPEVKMTCDRITIINRGQVVATNTPDELVRQLQGSTSYDLDVSGNVNDVVPQIEQLEFVDTVSTSQRDEYSRLSVRFYPGATGGPELAKILIDNGLDLYEMRRSQASLEDVFLDLTTADPSFKSSTPQVDAEYLLAQTLNAELDTQREGKLSANRDDSLPEDSGTIAEERSSSPEPTSSEHSSTDDRSNDPQPREDN